MSKVAKRNSNSNNAKIEKKAEAPELLPPFRDAAIAPGEVAGKSLLTLLGKS